MSTTARALPRLRRVASAAALLLAATASAAGAQSVSVAYEPGCGAGTACSLARFTITAGSDALFLNSLTLTAQPGGATFLPAGGFGTFAAADDFGPFGGATTISAGGTQLVVDFLESGAPFTLGAGGSGHLTVDVEQTAGLPLAFTFTGLTEAGPIAGTVATVAAVPEPATLLLVATGLGVVGAIGGRARGRGRV